VELSFSVLVILWIVHLNPFSVRDMVVDIDDWLVYIVEFRKPNSPKYVSFLVTIFCFSLHFTFSFDTQNLPFIRACSHVSM